MSMMAWFSRMKNISLSRIQTIVGLTAGLLSITFSLAAFLKPKPLPPGKGQLVTIVQDSKTDKAVSDATIEVLTSRDALITTLTPDSSGTVRYTLDEGRYRLRVSHPKYKEEVRDIQLTSNESTKVRVQLRGGGGISDSVRRLFHRPPKPSDTAN